MYTNGLFTPINYGGEVLKDCINYCCGNCKIHGNMSCGVCRYYNAINSEQKVQRIIDAAKNNGFLDAIDEIDTLTYFYKDDEGEVSEYEDRFGGIDADGIVHFITGTGYKDILVPVADLTRMSINKVYNCINH